MSSVSTVSAPTFTGVSTYASDLQQVITNAVANASIPIQQEQDELTDLQNQSTALSGLDSDFSALQTAFQSLQTALGTGSYGATSSDPTSVGASASTGALDSVYSIAVSSVGSYSTSVSDASLPAVSDPSSTSISTSTDYTLTVDGKTFDIKPADGSLTSLAEAINDSSAGVQASLVNTGSSDSPQYRLILTSTSLGPDSIQLNDGSQDLLDTLNTGTLASYTVNGLGTAIQSTSRTETLAPGVTIQLLASTPSGQPVTVTVARDMSSASSAISNFVTAYNTIVTDLGKQYGSNAGALSGESILSSLRDSLRQITQYTASSGTVASLAEVGINLDETGMLSFDSSQFNSDSASALQSFFGDGTTTGFLKAVNDAINSVEDSTTGSLKTEETLLTQQIASQNTKISDDQQKVTDLQNTLTQQMAAADAAIATLENQKDYFTNLFTAMINASTIGVSGVSSN